MTTVVLLHALPFDASMWSGQLDDLRRGGHHVLTPDQRGFGSAPLGPDAPSLAAVADDLAQTLDARGVRRAVLVGVSLGGYVAMQFLRHHAARVAGLLLSATRATADTPDDRARREQFATLITDPARRPSLLAATTPALIGATTRAERPNTLRFVREAVEAADPAAVAWTQRAIARRPDAHDVLGALEAPTVVVAGAEDELVRPDESQVLARAVSRSRLVTVPAAGHLTPLETPRAFNAVLTGLLREVS